MRMMNRLGAICLSFLLLLTLTLPSCAAAEESGFTDVAADAWYAQAVRCCRDNDWMHPLRP